MAQTRGMEISFRALPAWVGVPALSIGGIGAYPTWRLAGRAGIMAQLLSGAIVLAAMAAAALWVVRAARGGPGPAAFRFVSAGLCAGALSLAAAAGVYQALLLPPEPLFLWLGVLFPVTLLGEGFWLAAALKRDARRAKAGPQGGPDA